MSVGVTNLGGRSSHAIEAGAWCRGDQRRDLGVTITRNASGQVDHVSVTHRSLTPEAVRRLFVLLHPGVEVRLKE